MLQNYFLNFHEVIKMKNSNYELLREKRDIILNKLSTKSDLPSFRPFNQGSYSIHTAIEPESDQEYDIDVGLIFNCNTNYASPTYFKDQIYRTLETHTDTKPQIKDACVTVSYKNNPPYHLDLVTYVKNGEDFYMAEGYGEDEKWTLCNPLALINYINTKIQDQEEKAQFRRVVKYLKKWKNVNFSTIGHANPPSIGITLIALENFKYYHNNDLFALRHIVSRLLNHFFYSPYGMRIVYNLPSQVIPSENIFKKMSEKEIYNFHSKTKKLYANLDAAIYANSILDQLVYLRKEFGSDFPNG